MTGWFKWHRLVIHKLNAILVNQEMIMSVLDDLTAEVTASVASIEAAIAVITAGSSDSAQLAALTKQLADARTALNAAVAARSS